jgi:hypothetical protein
VSRREQNRRLRATKPWVPLYDNAQYRARRKGIPCTITAEDIRRLLEAGWFCAYCENPVGRFPGGNRPNSATLDRLIPEVGYTPANVVLCCHRCNTEKAGHTPDTLRAWADKIDAIINRQNPKATA